MLFKCLSQLKCAALTKKQGEYHGKTGMLFLMSGRLRKSGAEWYFVANHPALSGPNSFDLLEGEVAGSLRGARQVEDICTGRGHLQAVSLWAAGRAVLTLTVPVPCCWGTQGPWHPSAAWGGCVGASGAEQPRASQRSRGSRRCRLPEPLPGSHWACAQMKEPRHYALASGSL